MENVDVFALSDKFDVFGQKDEPLFSLKIMTASLLSISSILHRYNLIHIVSSAADNDIIYAAYVNGSDYVSCFLLLHLVRQAFSMNTTHLYFADT